MPSHRTHTVQPRKHARNAAPARFGIRNSAFAIRPARQNCGNGKAPISFKASTLINDNPDAKRGFAVTLHAFSCN